MKSTNYLNPSLPFALKTKPVAHYFEHGVIKFAMSEGKLYYQIRMITKQHNALLLRHEVKSKEQLDRILAVKSLDEIRSIEVVSQ